MSKPQIAAEEKFARRNALFRWKRLSGTPAWIATGANVVALAVYIALSEVAHWPAWAAIGAGFAVWVAGHVAADSWPRPVPPELAGEVARLRAGGSSLIRRHPFLCTEKDPHVHMTYRNGTPVMIVWCGESPPPPGAHRFPVRKPGVVVARWRGGAGDELKSLRDKGCAKSAH